MTTIAKQRYRTPSREAYAEVSLSEFSREDIEGYLAHLNGEDRADDGEGSLTLSAEEMNRIETLILCGQREAAREWVCGVISKRIGRTL